MAVDMGRSADDQARGRRLLPERARTTARYALRRARFTLLRALAAVCEPITTAGLVRAKRHAGILMFHRVAPEVRGAARLTWNVPPDLFRRQLAGLLRLGFEPWSLRDLLASLSSGREFPPRVFVVTFDDGYANVHDYAWPILRELNIPATVFLATHYLDQEAPFPFDDWPDIRAPNAPPDRWRPLTTAQIHAMLADPLIEFGCHTHMHRDYRGAPEAFAQDVAESIALLQARFGIEAPTFAFPFGAHDDVMVDIVRAAGACCALSTVRALTDPRTDPFRLGRFNVDEFETSATLSLKLDGWYERLKPRSLQQLPVH